MLSSLFKEEGEIGVLGTPSIFKDVQKKGSKNGPFFGPFFGQLFGHFFLAIFKSLRADTAFLKKRGPRIWQKVGQKMGQKMGHFWTPFSKRWGVLVTPYLWDFSKMTTFLDIFGPPSEKSKREFGAFLKKAGFWRVPKKRVFHEKSKKVPNSRLNLFTKNRLPRISTFLGQNYFGVIFWRSHFFSFFSILKIP